MTRSAANELSRECLYTALLQLMEQKAYSKITVTEIAERAGVSRMAYYRNYGSKGDILLDRFDGLLRSFEENIVPGCAGWMDFWSLLFQSFRQNRLVAAVLKADLKEGFFQRFSRCVYHIFQERFSWDMTDYHNVLLVNYQIGALLVLLRHLMEDGRDVSDEQAAAFQVEAFAAIQKLAHIN